MSGAPNRITAKDDPTEQLGSPEKVATAARFLGCEEPSVAMTGSVSAPTAAMCWLDLVHDTGGEAKHDGQDCLD